VAETDHEYTATRDSRSTYHEIIGRKSSPASIRSMSLRAGSLGVVFKSYQDAHALEEVLESGAAVMFRQSRHQGMDMYFHARTTAVAMDDSGAWTVAVGYQETAVPAGDVTGSPYWTFADVAADYSSFATLAAAFESYATLATGVEA